MRSRFRAVLLLSIAALPMCAAAGGAQSASNADGLTPGNYLRASAGVVSPINPQGSLRDWDNGETINFAWENWQPGSNGVGAIGYALALDYSRLPLNETQFLSEFQTIQGARATSASSSSAQMLQISTIIRVRIPSPYIMPTLQLGFGLLSFQPSSIKYQSASGSGTTSQRHRTGASISLGGGVDKRIYGRAAIFGDAVYTYSFTSIGGQAVATANGICTANGCDALKNTAIAVVRGGLRVRIGQ